MSMSPSRIDEGKGSLGYVVWGGMGNILYLGIFIHCCVDKHLPTYASVIIAAMFVG